MKIVARSPTSESAWRDEVRQDDDSHKAEQEWQRPTLARSSRSAGPTAAIVAMFVN